MHDREKVIKEKLDEMVELTRGLSYAGFMTAVENANDILAMLKEQEVIPILIREGKSKMYNDYRCPRCDQEIVYEQNYCSECGKPIAWKGR